MKYVFLKLLSAILVLICTMALTPFSFAHSSSKSWYIKRNGNEPPSPPPDIETLKKHNAFYINDTLFEGEKKLYLTFDAGYENGNIERIVDILEKENITAAFFVLDHLIIKNTDLINRMANNGHLICNHTKNHKNLSCASKEEISKDLSALEDIYREYTGRELDKYFRFPEGKYSEEALKCVNELGYKTVFWSFAYADWDNERQPSREYAIKKILDNTHNGAIILLHPTSKTNADILDELICTWRNLGYEFGSLNEIKQYKEVR